VRRTSFVYGDDRVDIDIRPAHGDEALYAPRRTVLDPALAAAARAAGADVRFGTAMRALLRASGAVTGVELELPGRRRVEVRAGIVIGADGRRSLVARQVGTAVEVQGLHAAAGIYAYVDGLADRGNRWHYVPGLSAGAIPTNHGQHCVFASMPRERFLAEVRGDLAGGLARVLAEVSPELAAEVGRMGRAVAVAGEPGWLRRTHGPGWALVGDAGYFKDPITAHGITDALRDAEILARAAGETGGLARYQAQRDALSLPLFRTTDAIAGFGWDLAEVQELHLQLNRAMKAEQDWLATAWELPKAA
jgi:flavin-dependent dehydrogenase